MRKILVLVAIFSTISTSCSTKILLPYEENTVCNLGKEGGYCGSLSDVYEYIEKQEEEKKWLGK